MITLEGTIEDIVFTNEVNGYTICELRHEANLATVVGYMPFINVGETLKVTGKWVTHPEYGEQLKVELYEKMIPKTIDAIEKYLASGIIKGVGPATASKIVDLFGEKTMEVIHSNPGRLSEIKGINMDKAIRIGLAFDEQKGLREVVMFFQEFGISPAYATKTYKIFGENTINEVKNNPYKLADEIIGIGFKTADQIAKSIGIDPASKFRMCSGIKYVLSQATANGHTFMSDDRLKEYTSQLLEINVVNIQDALVTLLLDKSIYTEKVDDITRVYLNAFYNAECGVSKKMTELSSFTFKVEEEGFEKAIEEVQIEEKVVLAQNQKTAVKEALLNGVMVITGGPGTGKTTIIKNIIKLFNVQGFNIALAAPTGRAAKRMSEATGVEAKTIHRLLEIGYVGVDNELIFSRTDTNPLEADAVIIDEMSMVDVLLMNHLLKAIKPGTRLILVGDVDQLSSVGAGNVLKDIISSGMIKIVRLTEIFRQAQESMIIVNAHRINNSEQPFLNKKDKDFFFLPRRNGEDIVQTIVELCNKRLPDSYGYDPMRQIQVLTPTRKGIAGVINLNIELQKALNPEKKNKRKNYLEVLSIAKGIE